MVGARARPPSIAKEPFYVSGIQLFCSPLGHRTHTPEGKNLLAYPQPGEQSCKSCDCALLPCFNIEGEKGLVVISERLLLVFGFVLGRAQAGR